MYMYMYTYTHRYSFRHAVCGRLLQLALFGICLQRIANTQRMSIAVEAILEQKGFWLGIYTVKMESKLVPFLALTRRPICGLRFGYQQ